MANRIKDEMAHIGSLCDSNAGSSQPPICLDTVYNPDHKKSECLARFRAMDCHDFRACASLAYASQCSTD